MVDKPLAFLGGIMGIRPPLQRDSSVCNSVSRSISLSSIKMTLKSLKTEGFQNGAKPHKTERNFDNVKGENRE